MNRITNTVKLPSTLLTQSSLGFRKNAVFIALLLIFAIFYFLTDGVFLSVRNLSNLSLQVATIAIIAMGMVLVIVSGHIDLSAGSLVGAVGAVTAVLQVRYGVHPALSVLAGMGCGILVGMWHGFWIAYRGVPSIIVTLASMLALRGGAIAVTGGRTQSPLSPDFLWIGQSYVPSLGLFTNDSTIALLAVVAATLIWRLGKLALEQRLSEGDTERSRLLGKILVFSCFMLILGIMSQYRGLPVPLLIVFLIWLTLSFIGQRTVFGRHVYSIGGNARAAMLSGIDVKARLFWLFTLMAAVTSLAALVFTARVGSASASAGSMMELDAIAAAIIGGTSLSGGIGTIGGAFVGAVIMATLDNGMSLMNLDASFQLVIKALILLLAVWFDSAQKRVSS